MITPAIYPDLLVPDDLRERDQWIVWRRETSGGRETKIPYSIDGRRASSTNPPDWTEYMELARESWEATDNGTYQADENHRLL
jgi:putative DNA primase/helicase